MARDVEELGQPVARQASGAPRLAALDGLRGLAALIVVFSHLSLTLVPFSDTWIAPTATHPPVGSFDWWFTSTPAELLIAGPEAVLVFFVLSGLVVALPVLRRASFDWIAYFPQRVARLWLPVAASVVLAVILVFATDQTASRASSLWVAASSVHNPPWQLILSTTDLLFGSVTLNNPLWTLRWELVFSLMLPLYVILAVATRRFWWIVLLATLPVVFVGVYANNGTLNFLPVFLVGTVVAVKLNDIRAWVARYDARRWFVVAGVGVLIASLLLLDLHWTIWGMLGGAPRYQSVAKSLEYVGAFGLVLLAAVWRPAMGVLSTRPFQWLGRVSFSLYLVHVPIILAIDSVFGRQNPVLRVILSLAAALVVAALFSRFVERPAHRFSKALGAASSRAVTRWHERQVDADANRH